VTACRASKRKTPCRPTISPAVYLWSIPLITHTPENPIVLPENCLLIGYSQFTSHTIETPVPFPSVPAGIFGTVNGPGAFRSPFLERERLVPFRMPFRTDRDAQNCLKRQPFQRLGLRGRPVRSKSGISRTGTENGRSVPSVPFRTASRDGIGWSISHTLWNPIGPHRDGLPMGYDRLETQVAKQNFPTRKILRKPWESDKLSWLE